MNRIRKNSRQPGNLLGPGIMLLWLGLAVAAPLPAMAADEPAAPADAVDAGASIFFIRSHRIVEPVRHPDPDGSLNLAVSMTGERARHERERELLRQAVEIVAASRDDRIILVDLDVTGMELVPVLLHVNPRLDLTETVRQRFIELRPAQDGQPDTEEK